MIRDRFAGRAGFPCGSVWLMAGYCLLVACPIAFAGARGPAKRASSKDHYAGRELFVKVWEPGKRSPAGGDGVGPLYNETSCVACHRLGGVGGGGGNRENVTLLTADAGGGGVSETGKTYIGELEDLHFGFRDGTSVVLHRHSTNPADVKRLEEIGSFRSIATHDRRCVLRTSSRNTPALFGAGLIDEVPEEVLIAAQRRQFEDFPEIQGRVSRLPDGRIGRFGWKGQTATLREFVLAACANELGLEAPDHHQARLGVPGRSDPSEVRLDMDQRQCDQLVEFVAGLAPPRLRPIVAGRVEPWGYSVFEAVGCATCHTPRLGALNGLYSDLLLHDMGDALGDVASSYGVLQSGGDAGDLARDRERARIAGAPAVAREWRTPPLWGVADSAPYLHDGRARTLHDAIRLHGGEAAKAVQRYSKLARADRVALLSFLHSLTAAAKGRKGAAIEAIQARSREQASPDPDESPG
jgi:CxxC motif-containing protein (DUF1111 family)